MQMNTDNAIIFFLGLKLTFEQIQMLQNSTGKLSEPKNTLNSQRVNLFLSAWGRYHGISFTFSPDGDHRSCENSRWFGSTREIVSHLLFTLMAKKPRIFTH